MAHSRDNPSAENKAPDAPAPRKPTVPFGRWPSPLTPADVARGTRRFGLVQGDGDHVYWTEGRPEEKGRQTLLRARPGQRIPEELITAPWSARSRVHEYGGGEFLAAGDAIYFVNDADQDVHVVSPGSAPRRITTAPAMRFADFARDAGRSRLLAVAERTVAGQAHPENLLVAMALDGRRPGAVSDLATGRDFYAAPRLSPDGTLLAFIAWDLPGMPWDEAALYVAKLDADGAPGKPRRIAGGTGVAASHPAFAPDGTLVFITDENGWGNLWAFDGRETRALTRLKKDFGRPPWALATKPYAIDALNRIWAAPISGERPEGFGSEVLGLDTRGRKREWHALAENQLDCLSLCNDGLVAIASAGGAGPAITCYTLGENYGETQVRAASDLALDDVALPKLVTFASSNPGGAKAKVHGFYYAPTNSAVKPPRGAKPPALVLAHGGPTSMAGRSLSARVQFYTSRGFAVLDVDYAGSSGYGRAYRERLDGQWGLADVADCAAGARWLGQSGLADPGRIAIAGGSAGGYTVLMALATTQAFAAGASHYGISDLALLLEHTHKFESGYLHRLMGTTPKTWKKVFRERSPLTLIDGITAPVILFQGLEDRVVPPEQSRRIAEQLRAQGTLVALHEFAGEAHGFRRADTIVAVLEAELAFLLKAMHVP